jgi:hypothetical protein
LLRDEPGGSLLTGQVGVRHGWWRERGLGSRAELGNLSPRRGGRLTGPWVPPAVARENPKQRELRGAEYRCGAQGRTVS